MKTIFAITFVIFCTFTSLLAQSGHSTNTNTPLINPTRPIGEQEVEKKKHIKMQDDANQDIPFEPQYVLPISKTKITTGQIYLSPTDNIITGNIPVMPEIPMHLQNGENSTIVKTHQDDNNSDIPVMPEIPMHLQNGENATIVKTHQDDNNNDIPVMPEIPMYLQNGENTTPSFQDNNNNVISNTPALEVSAIELTVFPNPTADVLYIRMTDATENTISINIHNLAGQQVYSMITDSETTQINSRDWAHGLYIITVLDQNGERMSQTKVMKQ
jgi:hypothetical protein